MSSLINISIMWKVIRMLVLVLVFACSMAWRVRHLGKAILRIQSTSSLLALHNEVVYVPAELDLSRYEERLRESFPKRNIIRWYVSRIKDDVATIEATLEGDDDSDEITHDTINPRPQ
jgi:hypothetical protein